MSTSEEPVNAVSTKTAEKRRAIGAPAGNRNSVKHGIFSMERQRKQGQMDRRTRPYRAIAKREREILSDYVKKRKRWHAAKAAKGEYYCERIDAHLLGLKQLVRKGKVNPAVELWLRIAESVDDDYDALEALVDKGKESLDLARRLMVEAHDREVAKANGGSR